LSGLLAMLATTALLVLAYPPNGLGWLAYVALTPFFFELQQQRHWRKVVAQGALLGVLLAGGLLYFTWMIDSAAWYQRLGASLAVTVVFTCEGIVLAISTWQLLRWMNDNDGMARGNSALRAVGSIVLMGMLWAAVEWGCQKVFLGLSLHLGLTQWRYPVVVRLSGIGGLVGLSGVLASVNGMIYFACQRFLFLLKQRWETNKAYRALGCLIIVSIIVMSAAKGALRPFGVEAPLPLSVVNAALAGTTTPVYTENEALTTGKTTDPKTRYLDLVLIQNAYPLPVYEAAANEFSFTLELYERLQHQSQAGINSARLYRATAPHPVFTPDKAPAMLVVWPETVLHLPMLNYPSHALSAYRLAYEAQTWILAGFPWVEGQQWYNSAILIDPEGQIRGRYSKVRPIPIAESWVTPGDGWQPLQVDGISVGVGLCSELIDPLVARTLVKNGAEVLVYLSSLSYLGVSSAIGLQGAFAPFRAAETGRYVAQAGIVGATLIAAPDGTIKAALPSFETGTLVGVVPALNSSTFYMAYGQIMLGLCFAVSLLVQVEFMRQQRKRAQRTLTK
jgi:apolipoprotein N-acyltransferase